MGDESAPEWADLRSALEDRAVVERWLSKIALVPGSDCEWWTGAISGQGHGRFWFAPGRVIIAHRFGWALTHGVESLAGTEVLGHRCDNPLCQRVGEGHIVASTHRENRREWVARRTLAGSPLGDERGARGRARALRDMVRIDPRLVAEDQHERLMRGGEQMPLW